MDGFIKIYRVVNGATEELKEVTLSKRSYWHHELGGIDYVMLFFSLDSDNLAVTTPFKEGDFITNPINGDKYFIMDLAVPNENNSGFWDFQLRFDSIITALSRNICKYTLQGGIPELSWKLTDSMSGNSVLKQAILASIARDDFSQSGQWRIDTETYVQDIDFTQQFTYVVNGEKYTELFDKICENYGCEWWNEKVGNDNVIYFGIAIKGTFIEFVDTETKAIAHQLQIISTSTQKSSEEYATRLYYRGSERNVPRNYNLTTGVKRDPVSYLNDSRLPLPDNTPYIESAAIAGNPHAGIELYEVNDSIYPRRIEHVTKVLYYKGLDDDRNEQRFYCVLTDNPVASIDGFKVDSSKGNLSISFSSGSLNGRTFEVQLHKEALNRANLYNLDGTQYQGSTAGTWYEIVAEGSGDSTVPNTYLYPSASNGGDECQLFNWIAYDTDTKVLTQPMLALIAQARQELYAAAQQRFLEISVLNTSFTCVPAKVGTPSSLLLSIGQAVRVNTAPVLVGASFSSRIRAVEVLLYNTNDRTYTVGIGSKYSRLGSILNSLRQNREDLLTLEDEVNSQSNPTVFQIREKNNIAIVRKKQDNSHVPATLSFDVFSIAGRTETKCTDRYVIRVKYDSGTWLSPDADGNFDVSNDFLVCTAAAFTDTTLEVQVAATTILMLEDGSRAAGLTITNPLQIIEVNEDWDVGYAFADNTDAYVTDIYSFSKGGNLPILDIDIFLEEINGTKVPIVVDGESVGTTSINGSPVRVVFSSANNRASLSIEFTSSSVQSLFTIPVLVSVKVSVDGVTSELAQTATIVFRQKGVDGTDGTDGSAASVRKLIVSPDYIVSDAEGNILSRQITFSGQISVGDGLPTVLPDVKFKAIIDESTVSTNITSPYTLPESCKTVLIEMYDETGLTLLDSQSIPIIKQGRVGKDAVTIILSNENHTLSLEDDRGVINYSGSGTSVKLVTAEYEFVPKDYATYPENERWQHLQPGEFFVHATGTDITVGSRSILGNSFAFGNASNIVGGTTGNRAAYIDFTIYFRAVGETQINYVTKRQNFSVAPSGFNVAIITLYKRSAEELAANDFTNACAAATPDPISVVRYNFITKAVSTLPAGWTSVFPSTTESALWAVQATARSRTDEDSIAVSEFSSPVRLLPSGANTSVTAVSTTTWNRTTNAVAAVLLDSNGQHNVYNRFNERAHQASSSAVGAIKLLELNSTTLATIRELTLPINSSVQQQLPDSFFDNIASDSIIVVSCYGNVTTAFERYIGNSSYDSLERNLSSIGCPRLRLKSGETFALVGSRSITAGSAILTINFSSAEASAFVKNGVFVNGLAQIKSETVTLFGRFTNVAAARNALPYYRLEYSFVTHSLDSAPAGWSQTFPDATSTVLPCFMIQATASGANEIDVIESSEWSDPVVYVRNGISISSADIVFYAQQSGSTAPADNVSWKTTFAELNLSSSLAEFYVWQATKVTYADETIEYTGKICLGQGKDFASVTEQYALGTSSAATGTWTDNTPTAAQKGSYLWTRTKLTYTGQSGAYYLPSEAGICIGYFGTDGSQGPKGDYTEERFAVNGSITNYPTLNTTARNPSGWSTTVPSVGSYQYLWKTVAIINGADETLKQNWSTPVRQTPYDGVDGRDGLNGPAMVFRGSYSSSKTYYGNSKRVDCVKYNGTYYIARVDATSANFTGVSPTNTSYWNTFGDSFESVATNLLLAENANIGDWYMSQGMIVSTLSNGNIIKLDASTPQILVQSSTSGGSYSDETSLGSKITISGSDGTVRAEATNGQIAFSYISPTGVFANRAGTRAAATESGYTRRGAIVGLGNGSLAASPWDLNTDEAMLAGVYGTANNSTYNGAPAYGGYFYKLKACGLMLHYLMIDGNSSTYTTIDSRYSQVIGISSSDKNVYLPSSPYLGQTVMIHQLGTGNLIVRPSSGQVLYDDDSANDYYDCNCGRTVLAVFCKYYINSVQKNVWLIRRISY